MEEPQNNTVKPKYSILYVDDEEDNLVVFKSAFRREFNVQTATSALEGLEIAKNQFIDLIITDQRMPQMTGIQFLKSLPEEELSIRIILTGYSDIEAVIDAINNGKVYRYITKPWNKEELKMTLDTALDSLDLKRKNIDLIVKLKEANEDLEGKVKLRTKELEEKNKDITDSITYAKRIQDSILPETSTFKNYFADFFILYKPKDIVSGDLYWCLEKNNSLYFAVIDCTGHGVPGAFMSLLAYNFLNRITGETNLQTPSEILSELDSQVNIALKQNTVLASQDGMDITLCRFDKSTRKVSVCSAMRPSVFSQNGSSRVLEPSKFSIGGLNASKAKTFSQHVLDVNAGDCLYLFTDGYVDQFGGERNKKIMNKKLYELMAQFENKTMQERQNFLNDYFENWMGKNDQIDDVLIMGLQF